MKRFLIVLILGIFCAAGAVAQKVTDAKALEYAKECYSQGMQIEQAVKTLQSKGVSIDQMKRLKASVRGRHARHGRPDLQTKQGEVEYSSDADDQAGSGRQGEAGHRLAGSGPAGDHTRRGAPDDQAGFVEPDLRSRYFPQQGALLHAQPPAGDPRQLRDRRRRRARHFDLRRLRSGSVADRDSRGPHLRERPGPRFAQGPHHRPGAHQAAARAERHLRRPGQRHGVARRGAEQRAQHPGERHGRGIRSGHLHPALARHGLSCALRRRRRDRHRYAAHHQDRAQQRSGGHGRSVRIPAYRKQQGRHRASRTATWCSCRPIRLWWRCPRA